MSIFSSRRCQNKYCGKFLYDCGVGRPPKTCSSRCRQAFYRQRIEVKIGVFRNVSSGPAFVD